MSSMLEQAIVDAQALREAALKNAEQALIEKFAPQIKDAVESLLEGQHAPAKKQAAYEGQVYSVMEVEDGKATIVKEGDKPFVVAESELSEVIENLLQEEEGMASGGSAAPAGISAPPAFGPGSNLETPVQFSTQYEEPVYEFDLSELMSEEPVQEEPAQEEPAMDVGAEEAPADEDAGIEDDLLADLELQEGIEINEDEDDLVSEIMKILEESDELLEEELIVDTSMQKNGTFETNEATLQYMQELELARMEGDKYKEENDELLKKIESLDETIKKFTHKNKQYKDAVEKLSNKLNETFLSNAKLLYSNRTLSDASLNERQKNKIVEAIAKARTPEEAKNLCETLNATVNSGSETKSPRTLSESVQRKSNLSGILPRRNKQANESETHTFANHMKKLAGIK